MIEINNSQYTIYRQALVNPSKLSEDDLLGLIVRFPYSQPLIFAYERRKILVNESSPNRELALLYAANANWLWDFVNMPVSDVIADEGTKEPEEKIVLNLVEDVLNHDAKPSDSITYESNVEEVISTDINLGEDYQENAALEKLVYEGAVGGDYFVFEKKQNEHQENPTLEVALVLKKDDSDDVSLYNDELMPYSFRWWLHKTRLEHAHTYRPFVSAYLPEPEKGNFDVSKIDETILDQQIKENIIHFQEPESKLSDAVRNSPLKHVEPKKTDKVIERFIKEEPIIQAPSAENLNNENMARQSAEDNYTLVTETLANIYVDQGLFLKAIEVFKKLIVKYPEKKSYFASRIEDLEKNL